MRRLSYGLLLLLLLVSCRREDVSWMGQHLEITLDCAPALATKAEEDEDDIYPQEGVDLLLHENLISTVDLFFYPGNEVASDAVYHVFKKYDEGKIRSDIMRLSLSSDIINSIIFPSQNNITQCYVFAVVNYPGPEPLVAQNEKGEDILTGTTLAQLEEKTVTTEFVKPGGDGEYSHYHANFMMSGGSVMSLRGRSQILAGSTSIDLDRYACKMTVGVNVAPQVAKDNEVWEPMLESMEIYLVDAVENVCLSGEMPEDPSYFDFSKNSMRFIDMETGEPIFDKDGDYLQTYPFYMYPQRWLYGNTQSPNKEPYLKLVLPWKRVMGGYTQRQYYYKIFIPDDYREENICSFVRNNWYHINIDVSILGSETDDDKVTPEVSFYVWDWQDKNIVIKNADIGKARYLSVERDTCIIYNEPQARMSYVSSHPVIIKDDAVDPIRVGRIYYGDKKSGDALGGTITKAGKNDIFPEGTVYLSYNKEQRKALNGGEDWFKDKDSAIEFTHNLNNNYKDPNFDYSYYVIHYVLVHADHPESTQYRKEQTIIQYPGIYLDRTPNPDDIVNSGTSSTTKHGGYVYINDAQYSQADYDRDANPENFWRVVCYNGGGTDMYKISVTVLPPDEDGTGFIIGDPRSKTSKIYHPNVDYVAARYIKADKSVSGLNEKRELKYYYPTEESSRTENMIAPSYRISTKLSGTYRDTKISKAQAEYRCAAFQESGFPAGRWRLPTMAEISFSAQLSANGVFTYQFSSLYWSANGVVNVDQGKGTVTPEPNKHEGFVRCVYDSWYWGDDRVLNDEEDGMPSIFVWGDEKVYAD